MYRLKKLLFSLLTFLRTVSLEDKLINFTNLKVLFLKCYLDCGNGNVCYLSSNSSAYCDQCHFNSNSSVCLAYHPPENNITKDLCWSQSELIDQSGQTFFIGKNIILKM